MNCIDCEACAKGWFPSKPEAYVCIGVPEPFVINDIYSECTEYPEKRKSNIVTVLKPFIEEQKPVQSYVDDDGIYIPYEYDPTYHRMLISKELFVEAYNKWIKGE